MIKSGLLLSNCVARLHYRAIARRPGRPIPPRGSLSRREKETQTVARRTETRYRLPMDVPLTPEQDSCLRRAVESGRFERPQDALRAALDAWVERERRRDEWLAAIDEAEAAIVGGDVVELSGDAARSLAEDIISRGLATVRDAPRDHS